MTLSLRQAQTLKAFEANWLHFGYDKREVGEPYLVNVLPTLKNTVW